MHTSSPDSYAMAVDVNPTVPLNLELTRDMYCWFLKIMDRPLWLRHTNYALATLANTMQLLWPSQ